MERHLSPLKVFFLFLILMMMETAWSQTLSLIRNIRIPLSAELDAYPELADAQDLEAEQYE